MPLPRSGCSIVETAYAQTNYRIAVKPFLNIKITPIAILNYKDESFEFLPVREYNTETAARYCFHH